MPRDPIDRPALPAQPEALLAARLIEQVRARGRDILMIASGEGRAGRLMEAASGIAGGTDVVALPAWDSMPFDAARPSGHVMGLRMQAVHRTATPDRAPLLLIASVEAGTERLPPASAWRAIDVRTGAPLDPDAFAETLEELGYDLEDRVDRPGAAAVRGSVIDLHPPCDRDPIRIDHSDGAITEMRRFDAVTQRSIGEPIQAAVIGPASEVVGDAEENEEEIDYTFEQLLATLHPRLVSVFELMPEAAVVLDEDVPTLVEQREADIRELFRAAAIATGTGAEFTPWTAYLDGAAWEAALTGRTVLRIGDTAAEAALPRLCSAAAAARQIEAWSEAGIRVGLTGPDRPRRRLLHALARAETPLVADWPALLAALPGTIARLDGALDSGFRTDDAVVLAPADVFGAAARRRPVRTANPFAFALAPGDAVIHLDHGVGLLRGVETVAAGDVAHDCLQLDYAGGTGLLVPAEEIVRVWRYGADAESVSLDRLKGESWPKRRADIEKDISDTAARLLRLMQARDAAEAPVFAPDRSRYPRLAARFPFAPTADQAEAIAAIEADLAAGRPMERLVCGDVGFGKTEMAIRAAGLAAFAGWQVAVVVPTTVLARQHIETFTRRFAGLGVRIAGLSRLTPAAEAKAVKAGLADGSIDVVVGTQAVTGKGVRFKRLGLVIVDEEQRFGARQKTALRELGRDVHNLTLTATPIPRTLQSALTGLQALSVLTTPPMARQPIRTVRIAWSDTLVAQALRREKRRGGQTFVVCPRIEDIAPMRDHLRRAAPDVRVIEAHGGMKPDALDDAMLRFANGPADVLLATTIIEAGLDLPRANTMLIWHPDRFGLAQMHQLRGRVGRGRNRGAVYLLSEPDAKLSAPAEKRIDTLAALNALGSGFAISARDLDLRGAGDLLGEEQAGHIKLLGVDLYQHLLERALHAARGEPVEEDWSPAVELGVGAYLPDDYIGEAPLRVETHDRLGRALRAADAGAIGALRAEMEDRFGDLPPPAEALLSVAAIQIRCRALGIAALDAGPAGIAITPRPGVSIAAEGAERKVERLVFAQRSDDDAGRIAAVTALLEFIAVSESAAPAEGPPGYRNADENRYTSPSVIVG